MSSQSFEQKRNELQEKGLQIIRERSQRVRQVDTEYREIDRTLATICTSVAIASIPLATASDTKFNHPVMFLVGVGGFLVIGLRLLLNAKENAAQAVIDAGRYGRVIQFFYDELADTYNELILKPTDKQLLAKIQGIKIQMAQDLYKDDGQPNSSPGSGKIREWLAKSKGQYIDWVFFGITASTLLLGASIWPFSLINYLYIVVVVLLIVLFRINAVNRAIDKFEKETVQEDQKMRRRRREKIEQWLAEQNASS